jgi:hypothetical protein
MDVSRPRRRRGWFGLCSALWLACVPGAGPGAQQATPERAKSGPTPPEPAVEAELRASPPPASSSSSGDSSSGSRSAPGTGAAAPNASATPSSAPAPATAPNDEWMACLAPPDPELDQESPWSRDVGQRLQQVLPALRRCTLDLDPEDEASITLRLVYGKDGSPISQHVVTSTSNACAASECLKQELAAVRSPRLFIDKASIDMTLALARNAVPVRVQQPVDPLTPDDAAVSANGCVDADVARLSQTAVRKIVSTSYDELQNCYGQALTRNHSATGKVTFEFVIGQSGSVSEAWARDATLQDCPAIECMLAQFRGLSFPEPVGRSVRIIYPISYVLEQQPMQLR